MTLHHFPKIYRDLAFIRILVVATLPPSTLSLHLGS